jgi:2-dehydropantoate 2-reductase
MRNLMVRSGQEALDAAVGLGTPIGPIFGLGPNDVLHPATVVETLLARLLDSFVRTTPPEGGAKA